MAAPASKNLSSCCPILGKPSNPRNSEVSNPMRRSFSGNPFAKPSIIANQRPGFNPNTPVNSPSDYPRRRSVGRENIIVSFRDSEDKENGKDQNLKQAKVRSPASSKGARNFMSPTISATSKINSSPRKKILTERNEQFRSSDSFSDGKCPLKEDLDRKPEKGLNQKKEVSFDPTITYLEDREDLNSNEDLDSVVHLNDDLDSSSESVTMGNDCVNLDPSFNISPRNSCSLPIPALAPLDADPSMPPYDPKNNYLSPRPQFLHYKPNPRIELYLNKERDGKQLEEIFASESSSDAEVTEEEAQSDDSQKESEGYSSGYIVNEEEEEEEEREEELLVSEPDLINKSEVAITAKKASKPNFFTRTKFSALLFVLAVACLWASVSNSPVMEPSVLNNLSFNNLYIPPEVSEFTRDSLEGLALKFRQWLDKFLFYIHSLIISFREQHKPGPLQFANLSTLLEDGLVDNSFLLAAHSNFKYESSDLRPRKKAEVDIKSLEEQEVQPIGCHENIQEVADAKLIKEEVDQLIEEVVEDTNEADQEVAGDNKEVQPIVSDKSIEEVADVKLMEKEENRPTEADETIEVFVEDTNEAHKEVERDNNGREYEDQEVILDYFELPVPIPQAAEIQPEVFDSSHSIAETDIISAEIESTEAENKLESLDSDAAIKTSQSTESVVLSVDGNKNLFSAETIMGTSLLVLSLLAAISFFHMKNQTSTTSTAATTVVPLSKKLDHSPLSKTTGHTFQERQPSSRNWETEVETIGESCPSEMSSFQYSSSSYYSKQGQKGTKSEAQSQERKPKRSTRRESMASSDCSMGSPSYGSFTIYEKVTNKQGNREEEWLTPVRRSSRIRHQVTSP